MKSFACKFLKCPAAVLGIAVLASAVSLAAAYTAELIYGLEPCILCLYQRIPFAVAIILGLIGLAFRKHETLANNMIALSGLTFLVNSGIAFYHTGVEQKWWGSAFEGCAVPALDGSEQSLLERIMSAPSARCDEIPWADPVLGLSMANYNIVFCFGLFAFCAAAFVCRRKASTQSSETE